MSTVCKIQVAAFLLKRFLCHGNKHGIRPFFFLFLSDRVVFARQRAVRVMRVAPVFVFV